MKKLIIFDAYNTLLFPPSEEKRKKWLQSELQGDEGLSKDTLFMMYSGLTIAPLGQFSDENILNLRDRLMVNSFNSLKDIFTRKEEKIPEQIFSLVGRFNEFNNSSMEFRGKDSLNKLIESGGCIALLSNTSSFQKSPIIENLLDYFGDNVFLSCDIGRKKPDKSVWHDIMRKLNFGVKETVMIGDSLKSDIIPAQNLGIQTLHINNNYTVDCAVKDLLGV